MEKVCPLKEKVEGINRKGSEFRKEEIVYMQS